MTLKDWTLEDWEKWIDNNLYTSEGEEYIILVSDLMALIEEEVTE